MRGGRLREALEKDRAKHERGVALLAFVAVIGIVATWFLVKQLNLESGVLDAARKNRNSEVLDRAKRALIGYVAAQAVKSGENRPGALPCPEAAGNYNDEASEGTISYPCTLPKVGRFPWRSLGLDKLVDASGEPLWYVVASGWAGANTVINSNCATNNISGLACSTGRLTVDGVTDDVIALIIAPGPAFLVAASGASCAAKSQVRPTSGTPDWSNYLECENATYPNPDATFATSGPSGSFNDQVVKITASELMPAIEAAIAHRIEREIVPLLNSAYSAPDWGLTGSDRVYPYAATFANPDSASYTGIAGTTRGLLPLVHAETTPGSGTACTSGAANPRCNPNLVVWSNASPSLSYVGGFGVTVTSTCSYSGPTSFATCNGTYLGAPTQITVSGPQSNGAMSLRSVNSNTGFVFYFDLTSFSFTSLQPLPSVNLNNDGTFTVRISVAPPAPLGLAGVMYWIFVPGNATSDHSLLDSSTASSTGWFLRNEWHKLTHYVVAPGYTAATAAPRNCTTSGTCLSVTNVTPAGAQRAILLLAGRSINGSSRPSSALADYLEFGNVGGTLERHVVTHATASAYVDTGGSNAYVVPAASVSAGTMIQFRALSANTGASTLNTPATGTRAMVNTDGSALNASTIQANGMVQVFYNGSQFLLMRRPFNDRIIVVGSN
jgi:hypothetical protein